MDRRSYASTQFVWRLHVYCIPWRKKEAQNKWCQWNGWREAGEAVYAGAPAIRSVLMLNPYVSVYLPRYFITIPALIEIKNIKCYPGRVDGSIVKRIESIYRFEPITISKSHGLLFRYSRQYTTHMTITSNALSELTLVRQTTDFTCEKQPLAKPSSHFVQLIE